jgi:integrase
MAGKYLRGQTWYLTWVEGKRQIRQRLGPVTETEAETARIAREQARGHIALAGPQFLTYAITYGQWHSQEYPDSYYRVEQILRQHLIPYFKRRPRPFVLPQVTPFSLTRAFSRTLGRADLTGSVHALRHTFCSQLVQAGIPLRTVQVLAGHSSIRITEKYAHLAPSSLRDAIMQISL